MAARKPKRVEATRAARPFAFDRRASGLLMHITSLPGPHGSGDLSIEAAQFIDFCVAAGQTLWQMLPVGPPGGPPGNSPYSSYSSAAGSPYLVALDELAVTYGLLSRRELRPPAGVDDGKVNFDVVHPFREQTLRAAYERFRAGKGPTYLAGAVERFALKERAWLDDFALFCALKRRFNGAPWDQWDAKLRSRDPAALERAAAELADEVNYHRFVQFLFDRQWRVVRDLAATGGVALVGDIPIYVVHDSVDVWCNPALFALDTRGRPTHVSGVPPDAFSDDGQLWGHPQYDWPAHHRQGFRWWINRFERTFRLFDAVRIDHFLGFSRVWSVPARSRTARRGKWVPSPGYELFKALGRAVGRRAIIAEDLGVLTPQAAALRDAFEFPGMRVMQFGFGGGGGDPYHRPHAYPPRAVAYTGTHDSDTVVGWFRKLSGGDRRNAADYTGNGERDGGGAFHWSAIRSLMNSAAETVIFPVQDVLGLDNRARMNLPGVAEGNWGWRLPPGALKPGHAKQLRRLAELSGRTAARQVYPRGGVG
jgi:4-alpha-glucanotransferase